MALSTLKQIVDELNTVATAFDAVNTFGFIFPSEVNNDPAKDYPMILLNANLTALTTRRDANSKLPSRKQYNLLITFWDSYSLTDKTTLDSQSKYSDLEIIADRYFAEVAQRSEDHEATAEFFIENFENITGTYVQNQNNDLLIGISYPLVIIADNLQCTTGTFVY